MQKNCIYIHAHTMENYKNYIKGGDILVAPAVHFKHQFILKCNLCDEYYSEFEEFSSHYLSHKDRKFYQESPFPHNGNMHKVEVVDEHNNSNIDVQSNMVNEAKHVYMDRDQEDDALMKTEEIFIKEEFAFQESRSFGVVLPSKTKIENVTNPVEISNDNIKITCEGTGSKDSDLANCIRDFMKSKSNPIFLVEAYKSQPLLWNVNYSPSQRLKERQNCLEQIAEVLKEKHNISLTCHQVSAILTFIRQKYKEKLRYIELGNLVSTKDKSLDYLKHMDFLKPFMENNSIAVISEDRQQLTSEQISCILKIYKRFPHLWDSSLVEYVCSNKRTEALEKMVSAVNTEMNLDLDQNLLDNYISSVHAFCSKEKRRDINAIQNTDCRPDYYEHITFLYEHVAPLKCPTCCRDFRNPLYYKEHLIEHDVSQCLKCSECNKEYKSAALYMEHAKRHMNDTTKVCKECGKQFLKTRALTHHMRIHTGVKPYVCDVCGNAFRHIQTFTAHKRTHNKEYVHFCPFCSKGFYTKSTMNVHVATHKSERNHVCPTCNKAFKTKINLTHHEWTHEDGCYPCDLCGKTYKNRYSLYQHVKNHRKNVEIKQI